MQILGSFEACGQLGKRLVDKSVDIIALKSITICVRLWYGKRTDHLLDAHSEMLSFNTFLEASNCARSSPPPSYVIGSPLRIDNKLYQCSTRMVAPVFTDCVDAAATLLDYIDEGETWKKLPSALQLFSRTLFIPIVFSIVEQIIGRRAWMYRMVENYDNQ